MKIPLRALIVEDSEFDAMLLISLLRKGGYDPVYRRVENRENMAGALAEKTWDIVISDYSMPNFSMHEALNLLQESGLDLPFIIVSGGIGEDTAVAAMKAGAHDYLMKGNLARLVPAVERELREASVRAARRQAEESLRESELRYRSLWETCTDTVLVVDTESIIHFANPAIEAVFGYLPEEVIGKSLTLLQPQALRERHTQAVKRSAAAPGSIRRVPMETVGLHKDGRQITIEIAFNEMRLQEQQWLVAFIRDITARKKAEATLLANQEQFRVAREIQQRLFPTSAPNIPGFDIAGASFPAEATGGDYFDYLHMLDNSLGIVVGDVTGHGIGPALLMAETRAYLRILARNRNNLGEIFDRANLILAEDVSYERYVTLILAKLNPVTRTLSHASAGHPPGYVLAADGQLKCKLRRTGIPLGLEPKTEYQSGPEVELLPGDIVLLVTDGVEEAVSSTDQFFGLDRLFEIVRRHKSEPAEGILMAIHQGVEEFGQAAEQVDDHTLVVIKAL